MQKRFIPVLIGYVVLAAISVVVIDLRVVLLPTACAVLALAILGLLMFRRLKGAFTIPWPATSSDLDPGGDIKIEGTQLPFRGYTQELVVTIRATHLAELFAGCVISAGALCVMFVPGVRAPNGAQEIGPFGAEAICVVGCAVLVSSLRWFVERRFLSRSHYTVGTIVGSAVSFPRQGITYEFFVQGERFAGRGKLRDRGEDNAVLVFYDPKNPDENAAQSGFHFHKFDFELIPNRQRQNAFA